MISLFFGFFVFLCLGSLFFFVFLCFFFVFLCCSLFFFVPPLFTIQNGGGAVPRGEKRGKSHRKVKRLAACETHLIYHTKRWSGDPGGEKHGKSHRKVKRLVKHT